MTPETPRKAPTLGRVLARLIDLLIAWALAVVFQVPGFFLAVVYLGIADGLRRGQSLGKGIIGLVTLKEDGSFSDFPSSLYRNIPFTLTFLFAGIPLVGWILAVVLGLPLILLETWLVFTDPKGSRLGDRVAGTRVVEKDGLEKTAE